MVPKKHSTIFKNRWMALIWAAGIIYFALQVAGPSAPAETGKGDLTKFTDATGATVNDKDMKKLEGILKGM